MNQKRQKGQNMKFIHIADVHLGVKPDAEKSWSEKRAQDIWDTFAETIRIAAKEQVDFLFIAGDLFHKQPLKRELKEVCGLFAQIPRTKVILMAGNHDYMQMNSYYRTCEFPENVFFFSREEVTGFDFPEENVTVYGLSYWHREITDRLYDALRPVNPGRINVLLAHGGDGKHIPFSTETILQNGFDYIAAGHIHKGGQLVPGHAVMAGALEPTDCNDFGPHGYWLGELEKGRSSVSFFPVKKCEYCKETVLVTPETTGYGLQEQIRALVEESPKYRYFQIEMEGRVDPDVWFNLEQIAALDRITGVVESFTPDYSYEKICAEQEGTLLEAYIRSMEKHTGDPVAAKALEYGVSALLGHQICR